MPGVEIRLLGPLEVEVSAVPVELRRKKQRALLALLALRPGEVLSTDRLVEDLWGHEAPKAAVGSLQNLISQLRKALGSETLLTRAPGYVLDVPPEVVDLHRFQGLVAEAMESGAADARAVKLRRALELWRGPALADLMYEPFAQAEIARLEELRLTAREELIEAELELGRHGQLVGDLEALVAEHSLRERLRGQLMTALYRSGRQADALEAYRQARETLVEELGIDPSPELQHLEQAILRQDPGLDLGAPGQKTASRAADRRKTVTILFTDVVDSTGLGATLDPEVLQDVMQRFFATVERVVQTHGGTVEKFIGDAVMAAFGIPTLHEDDALRAARAANDLHETLAELNAELERERGVTIQIRTGLNTGEVVAGDPGSGQSFATGTAVNVAMRIHQSAAPGEIVLGEATHRLVSHAIDSEPVAPVDLGAVLGQVKTFRLLGVGEAVRPLGAASLVGRSEQLAWLHAAFAGVQAERRSRVVTVLGDAGVGKSRLVSEFIGALGGEARALVGRCLSYGEGATYLPLAEVIRQAVPDRPQAAIAALLAGDEQASLIAEQVTQLTGLTEGSASIGEVFWAVRRFLEALAAERRLVVVLEDIHWAEPTLLDLVEYLDAWTAETPLLVLCLARPDLLEERPGWGGTRVLALEPLSREDAAALVAEIGADTLDEASHSRIVEIAEGNPLFLEQLLAVAEEAGADALVSVPPSVEALLAGRLDRLEPEERALLERAAVAGLEFSPGALRQLSPPGELAGLDGRLKALVRRGLLRAARIEEGDAFRFHHVLVRDVAYAGITKEARADLHERFAAWLEQRPESADEIVGYHFEQAHRFRAELRPADPALPALAKRAGDRLAEAGIRAFKRADTAATVNLLGRAASLLSDGHPNHADLLCELGFAQRAAGDVVAAEATLTDALARAEKSRNRTMQLRARIEQAYLRLFTDREAGPAELVELARNAIPVFAELGDERSLGRAWRQISYVRGAMEGRCAEWLEAAEEAAVHYRRSGWSASGCFAEVAAALFYGPTPVTEGLERCDQLLDEVTDRVGTANVLVFLGGLQALSGRFENAFSVLTDAETIYREVGEVYALADNSGRILGRVHMLAGDPQAAEQVFRECCERFDRVHDEAAMSSVASELGQAFYAQERYDEAAEWCRIAEEHAPLGDVIAQFSWRGLRGKLLAHEGLNARADAVASEAVRIAEQTDALNHRGEVLLDHARVLWLGARHGEASERIERALELFERKQNEVSARVARSLLAEVAVV